MGDPAALQEAIQRARQLAAKMNHQTSSQPIKRPASTSDHSGPIKVTLAYEKPIGLDSNSRQNISPARQRSSSRDHNRNERDRDRERDRGRDRDSRDYKDSRDSNHNRDSSRSHSNNMTNSMPSYNSQYDSPTQQPSSRGGEDKFEIIIPHAVIGLVIGKGGENIKRIQNESCATVRVDPNPIDERGNKLCTITGTENAVREARLQIENVIENAGTSKRPRLQTEGSDSFRMKIPASRTGAIIGKGGETIKSIKQQSGCDIELDKSAPECGPDESVFIIRGTQDKIMKARSLIDARLASRSRDGGMRDNQAEHHHSSKPPSKYVATGANAAPVNLGQFSDIPTTYPAAAGQQNSADMTAAWAAYFAQYSTLFNQTGAQPGTPSMPYAAGQPNLLGTPTVTTPAAVAPASTNNQQMPQVDSQQTAVDPSQGSQTQRDYSDQWIEYYLANGRPDYAEQIMQMKKKQQDPKLQQSQS